MNNIPFFVPDNRPYKYVKIDEHLSRSAQPGIPNFAWLKEHGVTDVFNFRTHSSDFDERTVVNSMGMEFHALPSITRKPNIENVRTFLQNIDYLKEQGRKIHIHCMAGADRTGMYSFIYKMVNNIGKMQDNINEWKYFGLNTVKYPHLISWAKACLERLGK